MKKTTLTILAILTMALTSCFKTDPTVYGCTDICTVENSTLISDFGGTYHVMETSISDWKTKNRMYISFDIIETTGSNEYNIRLNDYTAYDIKPVLVASSTPEEERGADPVHLGQGFISGSAPYFNIQCVYARKKNSTAKHDVNLIFDDNESDSTNLIFHLTHDAHGDTYMDGVSVSDCESVSACYSFPLTEFLKKGMGEVHVKVDYYWYKTSGNITTTETVKLETVTNITY